MARKSTIEKLKARISVLEKDRQRKVDEQIELILKGLTSNLVTLL